ncbi:hypothetical protein MPH_12446 [Macrophomina phaseolina MS6]|uniref:G-protein coupled receptors family 2 profile 2 domain-containing protein n=1 Tax=Macrophomina phaseolina (strain MS6) TaxID=1126212 RepID=K2R8B0_MACPH|nr:hypothetical protein MPH_12446 [Macrophomina phaseolina MS6]
MAASGTKLSSVMRGMEAKKHEYLIVARTSASISLLTTSSIILTYLLSPRFRKPMNRLLFYASLGNIFQATALFICTSGLPFPGNTMSLCRFQAFCIQMWVVHNISRILDAFDGAQCLPHLFPVRQNLRRLEPWYIAINYGWPFGHTFIMLMLDVSPQQTGIFGPAVMWCWISSDYEWMRLAFSYGPTWVIVLVVTAIFVVTGSRMVQQHYELTKLHQGPDAQMTLLESQDNERPYIPSNQIVRVTDIHLSSVIPEPDYSSSAVTREDFEHTESRERLEDEPDQDHSHQTEGSPSHDQYSSEKPDDEKPKHKQNQQHRPQRNANGSKPRLKLPPKVRLPPGVQVRLEDYSSSRTSNNPAARSPLQSFGSMLAQSRHSQLQSFGSLHVHGGSATWPCANAADDASPSPAKDDFVVHAGSARHTMATCTG